VVPRCFLALTLPGGLTRSLVSARERFLAQAPGWAGEKWVPAPNLHVTVAFLGDLDDGVVETAERHLVEATRGFPAFELHLTGAAAVPSPRAATMLWATLDDAEGRLLALHDALMTALPEAGFDRRGRLRPHVTLVRARTPRRAEVRSVAAASALLDAAGKEPDGVVSVRSVTLFSSTLRPTGPEYREIAVAHLKR
jgi:2'-5' RNA ligase